MHVCMHRVTDLPFKHTNDSFKEEGRFSMRYALGTFMSESQIYDLSKERDTKKLLAFTGVFAGNGQVQFVIVAVVLLVVALG